MSVRPPAVAGSFYPSRAAQLIQELDTLLAQVRANGTCRAIIAPHAGYIFSGRTAAHAFVQLPPDCQRVILLGPSHYRSFAGGALPSPYLRTFATPLGEVELDEEALRISRESPLFSGPASAHDPEHCLEVELPFLQRCTPNARVVPILVGNQTTLEETSQMAKVLAPLIREHTAVVVSSDFTHHGRAYGYLVFQETPELGKRLRLRAERTAQRAAEMDVRGFWHQVTVSDDSICGFRPIAVLLQLLAHTFSGQGRVLHVSTSGEVSGDWHQVVTYAAVGYSGQFGPWREEPEPSLGILNRQEREALLSLARATMDTHFTREEQLALWFAHHPLTPNLLAPAGAFVTLHTKERALRGCIGSLQSLGSLVDTVIHCAKSVLFDPRFPPVRYQELEQLEIEVSVLSPITTVPGPEAIRLGEHGVVLKKGPATAVFLPQVARETGWSLETFLSRLAQKAGLPANAWPQAELAVFTAQVFGEEELTVEG